MKIAEKFERIETLKGKIDEFGVRKDWDDSFFSPMLDFMTDRLLESLEEKLEFMKSQG